MHTYIYREFEVVARVIEIDLGHINLLSVMVRLGLAVLFGGIIGLDRGRKRMPAGFRTHILVCLGAALTMITNQYVCETMGGSDPVRLGAQVVSGIGFLGAGTIIVTGKNKVKGLTTAAALWASACMGLAIGIGFYVGAIVACFYIVLVMTVLYKLDEWMFTKTKIIRLYVELEDVKSVSAFFNFIKEHKMRVVDIDLSKGQKMTEGNVMALLTIKSDKKRNHVDIIEILSRCEGICYIEEI